VGLVSLLQQALSELPLWLEPLLVQLLALPARMTMTLVPVLALALALVSVPLSFTTTRRPRITRSNFVRATTLLTSTW
jgi:hypothetical protein